MKLTKAKITKLKKRGLYGDGGGLYLQVAKGGSKSWIQRIVVNGKRRNLGLGGYPLISLTEARKASIEVRRDVYHGINPLAKKRRSQGLPLFVEVLERVFEKKRNEMKSAKEWKRRLDLDVVPKWKNRKIDEIDQSDVIKLLKPIYDEKWETANKIYLALNDIFKHARTDELIVLNPADDHIKVVFPKRPKKENHASLHNGEVSAFMRDIMACGVSKSVILAFRLLVLTATRSGETRGAKWDEIDLERAEWTIPAERMKAGKEHRVPLSDQALDVLKEARELHDGDLIFPSPRKGGELVESNFRNLIERMGLKGKATIHGFRSSFRSWCAEQNISREVAEAALAHAVKGVEGDYQRSDLFDARREVMRDWAYYCLEADDENAGYRQGIAKLNRQRRIII